MGDFENSDSKQKMFMKLWRGERMCLVGFDVQDPEADLVGFAIECKGPGEANFSPLLNRLAFDYGNQPLNAAVTGKRMYPSTQAPFQKFRWIHFPQHPQAGKYVYRGTKIHMPQDNKLENGTSIELDISLDPMTYDGFVDVGFTRNFASSQAFLDKLNNPKDIDAIGRKVIPSNADDGLDFQKLTKPADLYEWMGFEAYQLIFDFLKDAAKDQTIKLDVYTYDFNEPQILALLKQVGPRLRIIVDDSTSKKKDGTIDGHGSDDSAETRAATELKAAGAQMLRTHFSGLQHNKVFIARKNGKAVKVLAGSTNHSFRGIYIQANNVLVFYDERIAGLFGEYFDSAFKDPKGYASTPLASKWHLIEGNGRPPVHICLSPHKSSDLSLNPVRGAIEQASSSVLYNVAFLNQIKSGPTKAAFDRLMTRPIFSYGVSDKVGGMEVRKPDGTTGLVDFAYLAANAPPPFRKEWSGQQGINVHHKFVVTDFSLKTAKVFTGSCNLSPSGEKGNGDHLIMIEDCKIAIGYAIEAVRIFDHLHFRLQMEDVKKKNLPKEALKLKKPTAISGKPAWFEGYYGPSLQKRKDRELFGH